MPINRKTLDDLERRLDILERDLCVITFHTLTDSQNLSLEERRNTICRRLELVERQVTMHIPHHQLN